MSPTFTKTVDGEERTVTTETPREIVTLRARGFAQVDGETNPSGLTVLPTEQPLAVKTITAVLAEVGDDPEAARVALITERGRGDDARTTLVTRLSAIAGEPTD